MPVPFPFVIDLLLPLQPLTRPMFGCHAVYVREKIVLILRNRNDHRDANGVWIATSKEHHGSLKKEMPSLQPVYILSEGKGESSWRMIHIDADDFEASVTHACELILKNDPRIGKIPKTRKKKSRG